MSALRGLASGAALFAGTLAVIAGLLWLRLDGFRAGLPGFDEVAKPGYETRSYPRIAPDDLIQLGWAQLDSDQPPPSSYLLFPEDKPDGKTRIGVFGCSFVYGDEAPNGADFPTFLQHALARSGREDVEVINFGVGGYGIHQAILLFRQLGVLYDLDVAIFNFYGFHRARDEGFLPLNGDYGPLHARYVSGPDGPSLVRVIGSDRRDAAEAYFGFVPRWQYLRFDARPAPLLRALVPFGRSLAFNPLYYAWRDSDEPERLYAALMDELVDEVPTLVTVCNLSEACDFAPLLVRSEAIVLDVVSPRAIRSIPSLYMAPKAHFGSLGNELVGEEIAAFLLGRRTWVSPFLELVGPVANRSSGVDAPSEELASGRLEIGSTRVSSLVEHTSASPSWVHETADLSGRGIVALLDFFDGVEFRFLTLRTLPPDGAPVELVFALDGEPIRAQIGTLRHHGPRLVRIGDWQPRDGAGRWRVLAPLINAVGKTTIVTSGSIGELELRIAGVPVLRASAPTTPAPEQDFSFDPVEAAFLRVRADTDAPMPIATLPDRGTLDLVLATGIGAEIRTPLVDYRIKKRPMRSFPMTKRLAVLAPAP